MTLDRENIQFIETYLKNSDVIFVDIRSELTDHIASAVEEKMKLENLDFYEAFKKYMVANKKQLLKSSNSIWKPSFEDSKVFLKTFYKPYNLLFAVFIVLGFALLQKNYQPAEILESSKQIIFVSFFIILGLQSVLMYAVMRQRYFYLEKNAFSLMIIYYANLFLNGFWGTSTSISFISIGMIMFLLFAYLIHYFKTVMKFKTQFQNL